MIFCRIVIVSFLVAICVSSSFGQTPVPEWLNAPRDPEGVGNATLTLDALMKQYGVPGVSIAVIEGHKIVLAEGYGIADVATGDAVTPSTLFQAASISKPVSMMAAVRAIQDGRFGLDDDINTVLRSWKLPENEFTAKRKVTPKMLLSHTGGTTVHGFPGYLPTDTIPTTVQVLVGKLPANTAPVVVDIEPFTKFRYSGGGTTIMQVALTDVYGKPFADIIREVVLAPIGMTDSGYEQPLPPDRDARAARAHGKKGEAMEAKWHVYPEQAAAGLWTTPTDLCKLAIEVQLARRGETNNVLIPPFNEMMITLVEVGGFGLGFTVSERGAGHWYFSHGGSNWGFQCSLIASRDQGNGAAIMTNAENGSPVVEEVFHRIVEHYKWPGEFDK